LTLCRRFEIYLEPSEDWRTEQDASGGDQKLSACDRERRCVSQSIQIFDILATHQGREERLTLKDCCHSFQQDVTGFAF
jgi:hypothetical protein